MDPTSEIVAPKVSVVLPTFNRARTLKRAIDSVLGQTFTDFELVIVDDRSIDGTEEVLRHYLDPRVRIISQLTRGCSVARNLGIAVSRGEYIAFQDSDDEWAVDKLQAAVDVLDHEPEIGVFYSDMMRVKADGTDYYFAAPEVKKGLLIDEDSLEFQVYGVGIQSAVIRKECFERCGLFDESLPRFIDLDLFIRLSDHFNFHHSPKALVRYYLTEGISTNADALVVAQRHLIEKYRERLSQRKHYLFGQLLRLQIARREALRESNSEKPDSMLSLSRRSLHLLQLFCGFRIYCGEKLAEGRTFLSAHFRNNSVKPIIES